MLELLFMRLEMYAKVSQTHYTHSERPGDSVAVVQDE